MNIQSQTIDLFPCLEAISTLKPSCFESLQLQNRDNYINLVLQSSDSYHAAQSMQFYIEQQRNEPQTLVIDEKISDLKTNRSTKNQIMKEQKFQKNRCVSINFSKFLLRLFITYFRQYRKNYPINVTIERRIQPKIYLLKKKLLSGEKQYTYLSHLHTLLSGSKDEEENILIRNVMKDILREKVHQQITKNKRIIEKGKKLYSIVCKVYALRCNNKQLTSRIRHR